MAKAKRATSGVRKFNIPLKPKKKYKASEKKKNYTVFVLDESGSMYGIQRQAQEAVNEQVQDAKINLEGSGVESVVSLVKFSSSVGDPVFWNKPLNEVPNVSNYCPNGMTAMLDAVGFAIDKLNQQSDINDPGTSVLFVIVSDGYENASNRETYASIAEKIQQAQDTGRWTFTYSGANQDLSKVAKQMNIPIGNTQLYTASSIGMKSATTSRSLGNMQYYGAVKSGDTASKQFYSGVGASDVTEKE